jgi:ribosomal protein S12 methylthiotransferase accessory factor
MDLIVERDEKTHLMEKIVIRLDLPDYFPIKYKKAVVKAAEMCTVKRNIFNPPDIQVHAV